ncbi:DMT family transporter [Domibacillus aminovorans]|uniref:DMT family transporter n=1 Tax=Domibacillus aminovorans TaxID=29332 RepID=UPI003CC7F026
MIIFGSRFVKKRADFREITKKDWLLLCFSGLFLALHFVLWFGSLKLTTVASSTIILTLQPVISLIGGFFLFKERTTAAAFMTMGIAIIGTVMIGWDDFGLSSEAISGDILSFLSVIVVVGYLLIGQNIVRKVSHWIYSFCVFAFASIFLIAYNLGTGVAFGGHNTREWGIFLLLAIVPTVAHVINNWLLNYVDATTISMSILGEPVGATLLAVLLLGVFFFLIQQKQRTYKKAGG